jgi:hypothetical protein
MKGLKYEKSYLNIYENGTALYTGLNGYFKFYNNERLNQSLNYEIPNKVNKSVVWLKTRITFSNFFEGSQKVFTVFKLFTKLYLNFNIISS